MARRTMTGQLNMFDFFSSTDAGEVGEVEMVSLMPSFEEEPEVTPEPEMTSEIEKIPEIVQMKQDVVMSRVYEMDGKKIEVAYINYNKVRVTKENEVPIIHEFSNSKEAVDYYVEYMQQVEQDK